MAQKGNEIRKNNDSSRTCVLQPRGLPYDIFYMYSTLVSELYICFPFDEFIVRVLRVLNVAPTQLHLNSWASL